MAPKNNGNARRSPRVDEAVRLVVEEGYTRHAAAQKAGCNASAVTKRFYTSEQREKARLDNLARNADKRAWENAHRYPCEQCGKPMGPGSMRADGTFRSRYRNGRPCCSDCIQEARFLDVMSMLQLAQQGFSHREIAERLDRPLQTVHQELHRLRRLGFDVPYDPYFFKKNRSPRVWSASSSQQAEAVRLGRTLEKFGVTLPSLHEDWEKVQSFLTRVSR